MLVCVPVCVSERTIEKKSGGDRERNRANEWDRYKKQSLRDIESERYSEGRYIEAENVIVCVCKSEKSVMEQKNIDIKMSTRRRWESENEEKNAYFLSNYKSYICL